MKLRGRNPEVAKFGGAETDSAAPNLMSTFRLEKKEIFVFLSKKRLLIIHWSLPDPTRPWVDGLLKANIQIGVSPGLQPWNWRNYKGRMNYFSPFTWIKSSSKVLQEGCKCPWAEAPSSLHPKQSSPLPCGKFLPLLNFTITFTE